MTFRSLRPGKTPAAAAVPAPVASAPAETVAKLRAAAVVAAESEIKTATIEPASAVPIVSVSTGPGNSLVAMLASMGMTVASGGGLRALATSGSTGTGGETMFPAICLTNASPAFAPHDATPPEYMPKLPQGAVGVQGMFLNYRYALTSWPVGFEDRVADSDRPTFSVLVPCAADSDIKILGAACSNYTFTAKANKNKFDQAASGVGHLRPVLEILMYVPSLGELMLIQSPPHFNSVEETVKSLEKYIDPETGVIAPFPCTVRGVNATKSNAKGTWSWKISHLDFNGEPNATGASIANAFAGWMAKMPSTPEISADFNRWVKGEDGSLMTPEIRATLVKAKSL